MDHLQTHAMHLLSVQDIFSLVCSATIDSPSTTRDVCVRQHLFSAELLLVLPHQQEASEQGERVSEIEGTVNLLHSTVNYFTQTLRINFVSTQYECT
jgi:hypothetical protein